jgi:hypothetical protein
MPPGGGKPGETTMTAAAGSGGHDVTMRARRDRCVPSDSFDALRVEVREGASVRSKAVYLSLAVLPDGTRDILGIWIEQTGGATFCSSSSPT